MFRGRRIKERRGPCDHLAGDHEAVARGEQPHRCYASLTCRKRWGPLGSTPTWRKEVLTERRASQTDGLFTEPPSYHSTDYFRCRGESNGLDIYMTYMNCNSSVEQHIFLRGSWWHLLALLRSKVWHHSPWYHVRDEPEIMFIDTVYMRKAVATHTRLF